MLAEYRAMPCEADANLVCFGAADGPGLAAWVEHWQARGLSLTGESGRSPDMAMHAAAGGAASGCDWLEIEEGEATFTGRREAVRRPPVTSGWPDALLALSLSLEHVRATLATPPEDRPPVCLKSFDGRFGLLWVEFEARAGLVVTDRRTDAIERFRLIEDLPNAGWALD